MVAFCLPILTFLFYVMFLGHLIGRFVVYLLGVLVSGYCVVQDTTNVCVVGCGSSYIIPSKPFPVRRASDSFRYRGPPLLMYV